MKRICIYDDTQWATDEKLLSLFWASSRFMGFDEIFPVFSWDEAYLCLFDYTQYLDDKVQIQFWGHGAPGRMYINGEAQNTPWLIKMCNQRVDWLWARACDCIQGSLGYTLAAQWTTLSNSGFLGHTRKTNTPVFTHQSGLYGLKPGQRPYWPLTESGGSYFWGAKHRTILTTKMTPPSWAWEAST